MEVGTVSPCLQLPRIGPFPLSRATTAPSDSKRLHGTFLAPRWRWRRGTRLSVSAVWTKTPQTEEAAPSPSSSGKDGVFDWLNQWYTIAPVDDLDPRAPHGKMVLGLSIVVVWYSRGAGEWRVFDDACPHHLAPLSEGRIDKGHLQYVYHGWCFDGTASTLQYLTGSELLVP